MNALQVTGQTRLCPDLNAGAFGKHTKEPSRRANQPIDLAVSDNENLVFHSLRHKFKDEARSAVVPDSMIDQITGHFPLPLERRYGEGAAVNSLAKQLQRVRFEMIDWTALSTAAETINWPATVQRLGGRKSKSDRP